MGFGGTVDAVVDGDFDPVEVDLSVVVVAQQY